MQKQIDSNSDSLNVGHLIDEQFRPNKLEENKNLQELVERDMRAEGYDPLNSNDVKAYWASKGIVN